jgi:Kef-type K+ transport system membrane component KefB
MMNTRALMELIVINVGLDLGVISPKMFTMLVIMAIFSTVVTTPALRHYLPRTDLKRVQA